MFVSLVLKPTYYLFSATWRIVNLFTFLKDSNGGLMKRHHNLLLTKVSLTLQYCVLGSSSTLLFALYELVHFTCFLLLASDLSKYTWTWGGSLWRYIFLSSIHWTSLKSANVQTYCNLISQKVSLLPQRTGTKYVLSYCISILQCFLMWCHCPATYCWFDTFLHQSLADLYSCQLDSYLLSITRTWIGTMSWAPSCLWQKAALQRWGWVDKTTIAELASLAKYNRLTLFKQREVLTHTEAWFVLH